MVGILAIPGSIRHGSYNRLLLESATRAATAGTTIRTYDELGTPALFSEDSEKATGGTGPDAVVRLRRAVSLADGLLISTPEYNQSVPGVLKNALDWLSRAGPDEVLIGEAGCGHRSVGGTLGNEIGPGSGATNALATESVVLRATALYVREAARVFDATGQLADAGIQKQLENVLAAVAQWIELIGTRYRR